MNIIKAIANWPDAVLWIHHPGECIRRERKRAGLTLKDLASQVDLSVSYLSEIERGESDPSMKSLRKIRQFFLDRRMKGK